MSLNKNLKTRRKQLAILAAVIVGALSVFHKDELTQKELRKWLDAEFSAISDAALRGGSRNA
ncbi:hypothetical protein PWP92_23995 [Enterobacter hormaechei subsp. xiangfangensis]|uniref:hypothetical protein n=1 Tax=Enterobacter hormaechei TaxID=158836 RepID=UPI000D6FDC0E|nr:hypothetical protein [Enterobacter hormaechei]MDE4077318.1 hypothetical protein [Enterobacter hormaechei subsp. xiangfangensis]